MPSGDQTIFDTDALLRVRIVPNFRPNSSDFTNCNFTTPYDIIKVKVEVWSQSNDLISYHIFNKSEVGDCSEIWNATPPQSGSPIFKIYNLHSNYNCKCNTGVSCFSSEGKSFASCPNIDSVTHIAGGCADFQLQVETDHTKAFP